MALHTDCRSVRAFDSKSDIVWYQSVAENGTEVNLTVCVMIS